MEAGYGQQNLGTLLIQQGITNNVATSAFHAAADYFARAIALQPAKSQFRLDLAEAEAWLADSLAMQQQYVAAIAARARQKAILEKLLKESPDNVDYRQRVLLNSVATAQIEMDAGNARRAAKMLDRAYYEAQRAAVGDPTNAELKKRARGIGFLYARALLLAGNGRDRKDVTALLAPCASIPLAADEQLMCATTQARYLLSTGSRKQARDMISNAERHLVQIRISGQRLRWGMDFDKEISDLKQMQGEI